MSDVFALTNLFDNVVARFAAESLSPPPQAFGWREVAKRTGALRIVWVPGVDGDVGEVLPPRNPGGNPRSLATLAEKFTVYCEAVDMTDSASLATERAQYVAARLLFDAWLRAVYLAAHGTFSVESVAWVDTKLEARFGATLKVQCTVQAMVPDEEQSFISAPESAADIAVTELDNTEHVLVTTA